MRTIKFRAWDKDNKRWLDIKSLEVAINGAIYGVWELREKENELYGTHQAVISEWTGLRDKHGVDIYEGDIVRVYKDSESYRDYEVVWSTNSTTYAGWQLGDSGFPEDKTFEVIGNIYEQKDSTA